MQSNIKSIFRLTLSAIAMAAAILAVAPATAQTKVTRLVVAFPPGGPVDFVGRTMTEELGKQLGTSVIIENRAGGNGAIAAEYVSHAAPDGNTLWLTSVGAMAINPAIYDKLAYDPVKDLQPVSLLVNNVELLVVNPSAPYSNGAEFIAWAKKRKDAPTMASSGTGSVPHLAMEQLSDSTKTALLHVPYKGAAPAITDVVAGHVDGFFGDIPGLIPFINAGKLKPIGIAADKRHPLLPNVMTFKEMGIEGVDSDNWYGLFAGKDVPAADIDRINKAVRATLANESVKAKLMASGAQPAPSSPAELAALLKSDTIKWAKLAKAKNIRAE